MLEIINKVRKEAGLYELKYSKELEKAAKIRAKEISVSLSHTRPDGSLWNTVNPNVSGENLIQLNASPEEVIKIQLGIEGQSKNIKKFGSTIRVLELPVLLITMARLFGFRFMEFKI